MPLLVVLAEPVQLHDVLWLDYLELFAKVPREYQEEPPVEAVNIVEPTPKKVLKNIVATFGKDSLCCSKVMK